jgi:hypothetical protein
MCLLFIGEAGPHGGNLNRVILVAALLLFNQVARCEEHSTAVFVSWNAHSIHHYSCPDNKAPIDPLAGTPMLISKTASHCEGKDCAAVGISYVGIEGSPAKMCEQELIDSKHQVFKTQEAANLFKTDCSTATCTDWKMRPATQEDLINAILEENHWEVHRSNENEWQVGSMLGNQNMLAVGSDKDRAIKAALLFQENHWKLVIVGADPEAPQWEEQKGWKAALISKPNIRTTLHWEVLPDLDGRLLIMNGKVTDGNGMPVAYVAAGPDAESATRAALKVAKEK